MFATTMAPLGHGKVDLSPEPLRDDIDAMIDANYESVNNGVYRCGFAGKQDAYEQAFEQLFARIEELEAHLGSRRFLVGERLSEADICLFTTLVRFDPVYYVHFKCNGGLIADHANLRAYVQRIYQTPGIAETVNLRHIKRHYYGSHKQLNPKGFVPVGPDVSWYES
jgi:putative glutathione S-transferase